MKIKHEVKIRSERRILSSIFKFFVPFVIDLLMRRSCIRRADAMKIGGERSAIVPQLRRFLNSSQSESAQPRQVALLSEESIEWRKESIINGGWPLVPWG